mgnify:CR=1 FL=1|tara:strand:+ start:418 stop:750 length:333 start_codon:yes stop_codon:yes gene_type:complete
MAFTPYHNITGSTGVDVELIAPGENTGQIKAIMITNTHATADATVTLFLENDPTAAAASVFKILSTVAIPSDTSLLLDNSDILSFDNSTNGYGLYITVGSSDTLDVMIHI